MRGYEWGNGTVRCSFCNGLGHNITSCSKVSIVAKKCSEKIEFDPSYCPTHTERRAVYEMGKRELRKKSRERGETRRKPRCSFCGQTGHKRNNCEKKKEFIKLVSKANSNWRNAFVNHMNDLGYGIGSLVSIPSGVLGYTIYAEDNSDKTGVIIGLDKQKLNVFCSYQNAGAYKSEPAVNILVDNQVVKCLVHRFQGGIDQEIVGKRYGFNYYHVKLLQSSANEVEQDFFKTDEADLAMRWFFSKISEKDKEFAAILRHVKKWADL